MSFDTLKQIKDMESGTESHPEWLPFQVQCCSGSIFCLFQAEDAAQDMYTFHPAQGLPCMGEQPEGKLEVRSFS